MSDFIQIWNPDVMDYMFVSPHTKKKKKSIMLK